MRTSRLRSALGWTAAYLPVLVYAALILVPLYYLLVSAFKTTSSIALDPLGLPGGFSLEKFLDADAAVQLFAASGNSLAVTIGAVLLTILLAAPAAHGIARRATRFSAGAQLAFGLAFLIPQFAVLVPTYLLAVRTGLIAVPLVFLVLFYAAMNVPLAVLLLIPFFTAVPKEIEESAELDGAGLVQRLRHVLMPIVAPGLTTVGILCFLAAWNEYIFAQVITTNASYTVQVALPLLRSEGAFQGADVDLARLAAGVLISVVPVFVLYAILRGRLIDAFAAGAVKG
ncbi:MULTISPECIES: carbohydrate ABC transporter permease [unclassified Rathayibacter]|uniref:carbohydrate ABC transporter permease n=1 Tax=unclassified Rathayibacter TaxID=2609250 RepID=UPI000CE92CF8|nr:MULTISPECIES: carbohydrate ABC transporter permease [unclassified Rathayibacter]PPF39519.1 transporter [Rathayibacter sp. AY1A3]PPG06273.1 transporter [Rathayibacter sp. AY2B1]PPG58836.1 transporter [Rathayibacter sp. AY2B7]PPG73801.1 transporter [Rathayibacter sp. AY1F4]